MKKVINVFLWIVLIFTINEVGRYLYVEIFKGGYYWLADFYIVIAGSIATLAATILFFTINYFITRKQKEQHPFSFNNTRFILMILTVIIAFIGEQIYLFLSDYFLFNS